MRPPIPTYRQLLGPRMRAAIEAGTTAGASREGITVSGPVTGHPLPAVPLCSPADARHAVTRARQAHTASGPADPAERRDWARRLRTQLTSCRAALRDVLTQGSGLAPADADAECREADRVLRAGTAPHGLFRTRQPRRTPRTEAPPPAVVLSQVDGARPLASLLEGALPALLRGSTVITELDAMSAPAALIATTLAHQAGLPPPAWQLAVHGPAGSPQAQALHAVLAEHTDDSAPQCCPRPLDESGRPRPPGLLVLRHDGHPVTAARCAARACFGRTCLSCAATPLIAVHRDQAGPFLRAFTAEAAAHPVTPSQLALTRQAQLRDWSDSAITAGARLHPLPPPTDSSSRSPKPIILLNPSSLRALPHEVPRGPIALVTVFTHWSEVLDAARRTGNHLSVFTRTRTAQLAPQFACLPATRIRINQAPRPGLLP
ncbi:aldehyde dehydrogenase family protein [Streptomyces sp. NPDC046887]|uniref:aldehyde dehydrogenase family protein n=1 Tax=Streptomyces sp. NPDC046887 TaxID=3155472 RepID=UPI0033F33B8F